MSATEGRANRSPRCSSRGNEALAIATPYKSEPRNLGCYYLQGGYAR
jgi:hypothetical protein